MNKRKTQKTIEQLADSLGREALVQDLRCQHSHFDLKLMMEDVGSRCNAEVVRYQHKTTIRRTAVNLFSCIVILLCCYQILPHSSHYAYILDGHLVADNTPVNNLNKIFA